MGPQLDSCGRANKRIRLADELLKLQWGRNLIVAEGPTFFPLKPEMAELQWGRNLIVAEGPIHCREFADSGYRFNGAAT